jgi:hypothetical protein
MLSTLVALVKGIMAGLQQIDLVKWALEKITFRFPASQPLRFLDFVHEVELRDVLRPLNLM